MAALLARLATILKWIVFAVLILAVVFLVLREGLKFLANFTDWAKNLLNALQSLWANLFKGAARAATEENDDDEPPEVAAPVRPFASYVNPFLDGRGDRMPIKEVMRYTFAALQASARERNVERQPEETPLEFAQRLGEEFPALEAEINRFTNLYAPRLTITVHCRAMPRRRRGCSGSAGDGCGTTDVRMKAVDAAYYQAASGGEFGPDLVIVDAIGARDFGGGRNGHRAVAPGLGCPHRCPLPRRPTTTRPARRGRSRRLDRARTGLPRRRWPPPGRLQWPPAGTPPNITRKDSGRQLGNSFDANNRERPPNDSRRDRSFTGDAASATGCVS